MYIYIYYTNIYENQITRISDYTNIRLYVYESKAELSKYFQRFTNKQRITMTKNGGVKAGEKRTSGRKKIPRRVPEDAVCLSSTHGGAECASAMDGAIACDDSLCIG